MFTPLTRSLLQLYSFSSEFYFTTVILLLDLLLKLRDMHISSPTLFWGDVLVFFVKSKMFLIFSMMVEFQLVWENNYKNIIFDSYTGDIDIQVGIPNAVGDRC